MWCKNCDINNLFIVLQCVYEVKHGVEGSKILKLKNMNKIMVAYGERRAVARILKTSVVTVRKALMGKSKSELARRIRILALERGGVEIKPTDAN